MQQHIVPVHTQTISAHHGEDGGIAALRVVACAIAKLHGAAAESMLRNWASYHELLSPMSVTAVAKTGQHNRSVAPVNIISDVADKVLAGFVLACCLLAIAFAQCHLRRSRNPKLCTSMRAAPRCNGAAWAAHHLMPLGSSHAMHTRSQL